MARYVEALTIERGGFRIKVPESWWEFDVRPESRDDSIRRMVNERVQQHPELVQHRDTYVSFLQKAAAEWDSTTDKLGTDKQKDAYTQFKKLPGAYADNTIEKLGQGVKLD